MAKLSTIALALFAMVALASCRQDMQDQPKYLTYRGSETFMDSLSSRTPVEGTVARGYLRDDEAYYTGKMAGMSATASTDTSKKGAANEVNEFPFPITRE